MAAPMCVENEETVEETTPGPESKEEYILKKIDSLKKPILESIEPNALATFQHYNLRYYENRYSTNFPGQTNFLDILVRVHSNKLMLLSLAEGNHIMQSDRKVQEVSFVVNDTDRSLIKTKGKRKMGAKPVHKMTRICQVLLEGENEWHSIRAGVEGYLLEANEHIKKEPNLIKTEPYGMGYLVIIMPKGPIHGNDQVIDNMDLMRQEEYFKYLFQRQLSNTKIGLYGSTEPST